ncbi:hypothetical protein ACHAXS_003158 [Conticribra weissflogii]
MMSSLRNGDYSLRPLQRLCLPLKDWVALSALSGHDEQENIRELSSDLNIAKNGSADVHLGNAIKLAKQSRVHRLIQTVRLARLIVDCITCECVDCFDPDGSFLESNDIATKSFLVEILMPGGSPESPAVPFSANEIVQKYDRSQIKIILEGSLKVALAPEFDRKMRFLIDDVIEPGVFEEIGLLFYELFTQDASIFPSNKVFSHNSDSSALSANTSHEKNPPEKLNNKEYSEDGGGSINDLDAFHAFKRLDLSSSMDSLQQHCLPIPICRLISDLIEYSSHFLSLNDVRSELTQILEEPEIFLYEENIYQVGLSFNDNRLHGRVEELSTLVQIVMTVPDLSDSNVSAVVLVGGDPGAGKSTLIKTVGDSIHTEGWHFLSCKFDRLAQNQPLSTISSAFNCCFEKIVKIKLDLENNIRTDEALAHYLAAVTALVETNVTASGIVVLSKLIPCLKTLFPDIFCRLVVDDDDDCCGNGEKKEKECYAESNGGGKNCNGSTSDDHDDEDCLISVSRKNRLHYLFQRLVRSISSPAVPMMLFLDDLQWADKESLDLLTSLVIDVDQPGLDEDTGPKCVCFFLAFRSAEGQKNESFLACIEALEGSASAQVTRLNLEGMDIDGTNDMISDALKLPIRLTRPLSTVVQKKTLGNPLYIKLFMITMFELQALRYSLKERRWLWDISTIQEKSMVQDLALLLSQKMLRMPRDMQEALTFLSCFGMKVHVDVLDLASVAEELSTRIIYLDISVKEGILEYDGDNYAFPHDLIQQAAYDRVPKEDILSLHFRIGMCILTKCGFPANVDLRHPTAFLAFEQIMMAEDLDVCDPSLRLNLVSLFLRVGKDCIKVAAFASALLYFERGISVFGEEGWKHDYELCLSLHESACHACYLNALPDKVTKYKDIVMSRTKNFMEQIKTHHINMLTLATTGKIREAVGTFFVVMKNLGEEFPIIVDPSYILSRVVEAKVALSNISTETLLAISKMTDKKKQWAMRFMDAIIPYMFTISPIYLPIIAVRMVLHTLNYGLVKESAFGLYTFSFSILCILQDVDEACRWTNSTLLILDRFNATTLYPKINQSQYSFLLYMKKPFQSITNALHENRQDALMVGDVEFAVLSYFMHCQFALFTGTRLSDVDKKCFALSKEMVHDFFLCTFCSTANL